MIEELIDFFDKYLNADIFKIILSNHQNISKYRKVDIIKTNENYHISKYTSTQVFNDNLTYEKLRDFLIENIDNFKQFNLFDESYEYMAKVSKKGKVFVSTTKNNNVKNTNTNQNNQKNYLIKEGEIVPPLIDMGIMTKDGKIISQMYAKFKQINKFLEIIDHSINKLNLDTYNIIDFGCGKSYLTFVLYYYFTFIKKKSVNVVGLDLKEDVIKNCNKASEKYGFNNLKFYLGNIKDYEPNFNPDIVITLHACDTATDYALYNAIKWNTQMIFSVPCCQHEINKTIKSPNKIIERYGIAKERISALFTDIIRCNLLEYSGYKTDLLEFVEIDATPKNLLIRGELSKIPNDIKNKMLKEVERLIDEYNISQTLYNLLIAKK